MSVCVLARVLVGGVYSHKCNDQTGQKAATKPGQLWLQLLVSHWIWVLETKLRSFVRLEQALKQSAISHLL